MLTTSGYALLASALASAVAGLALGNVPLLVLAVFPFALLLAARAAAPRPVVERYVSASRARRGDEVEIAIEVRVPRGLANVEVHQPLPPEFALVRGSNFHVLAASPAEETRHRVAFAFRATRRGSYRLPPVRWEAVSVLGLEAPAGGEAAGEAPLDVSPRASAVASATLLRATARRATSAERDVVRVGTRGTDYRELRQYAWGDPPKSINWKATARHLSSGAGLTPLVNEYEREGKRTVFVFVDASRALDVGTSAETSLDYALDAAQDVALHFLARGYRVGAFAFNARAGEPVYPDVGHAHAERIRVALAAAEPGEPGDGFAAAVERCHGYLARGSPFVVVLTRLGEPSKPFLDGLERLRVALGGTLPRALPVVVVNVRPYGLQRGPEPFAAEARAVLEGLDRAAEREVQRAGATVVAWDPARTPFATAFLRRVRA